MVRSHAQHLEALLAEQRLIAAQKPNLQLCWAFLEGEIARVKAAEKVNPTRSTPQKTPSGRAKHTPTPTKKPTPERHGKHELPESKSAPATYGTKKTTPEHAAAKKPAPIREQPKEKPSLVQRGLNAAKRAVGAESKVQPVQKEDALSPDGVALEAEEHRFGAGGALACKSSTKEEGKAQGLLHR